MSIVQLAEVKRYGRFQSSDDDTDIQATIDAQTRALTLQAAVQQEAADKAYAAAAADAIYRGSVAETTGKIDNMAQSLLKATDAQAKQMLAQASLETIKKAKSRCHRSYFL